MAKGIDVNNIPQISVIIVSYNTRELTRGCLCSVMRETPDLDLELIVVDNASMDGSVEMVAAEFPDAHLIVNRENLGFARANNQAFEVARGRYLLLLNPDTQIVEKAIAKTLRFAEATPRAGVMGCRVLLPDGRQQSTLFRYRRLRDVFLNLFVPNSLIRRSRYFGRERYVGLDLHRVQDVEVVAGCYMLVRREVVEGVGGMDDDFFMYGEEAEWCFRIRKAGWSVLYYPGARVIHYAGQSTKQEEVPMNLAMARSQLLFLQKTQGCRAAYVANLIMLLRDFQRLFLWWCFGLYPPLRRSKFGRSLLPGVARFPMHLQGLLRSDWSRSREAHAQLADCGWK